MYRVLVCAWLCHHTGFGAGLCVWLISCRRQYHTHLTRPPAPPQDNLARIADRRWVVEECVSRLAPDYESQRLLINYGLRETDRHVGPKAAAAAAAAGAAAVAGTGSPGAPASHASAAAHADGLEERRRELLGGKGPAGAAAGAAQWNAASIGRDGRAARWWRWRRLVLWRASDRLDTARVCGCQGVGGDGGDAT
jgi:hypothetical protein